MLLGVTRKHGGLTGWDAEVNSLSPLVWAKLNEANRAVFASNGNFGSAAFNVWSMSGNNIFGSTPIMPSDLTRTTVLVDAADRGAFSCTGLSPVVNDSANTIYCAIKLPGTGLPALIIWRSGATGTGGDFLRVDGTFCVIRVRGIDVTTTVTTASILNNVPHLIGVTYTTTSVSMWVDGVKVFTGVVAGTVVTQSGYFYMQNGTLNQAPYGNFGDFIIWNRVLSDPENVALYAAWN